MKFIQTILFIFFFCTVNANEIRSIVQVDNYSITNVDLLNEIRINEILRQKKLNDTEKKILLKNLIEEKIKKIETSKNNILVDEPKINKRVLQIMSNYNYG